MKLQHARVICLILYFAGGYVQAGDKLPANFRAFVDRTRAPVDNAEGLSLYRLDDPAAEAVLYEDVRGPRHANLHGCQVELADNPLQILCLQQNLHGKVRMSSAKLTAMPLRLLAARLFLKENKLTLERSYAGIPALFPAVVLRERFVYADKDWELRKWTVVDAGGDRVRRIALVPNKSLSISQKGVIARQIDFKDKASQIDSMSVGVWDVIRPVRLGVGRQPVDFFTLQVTLRLSHKGHAIGQLPLPIFHNVSMAPYIHNCARLLSPVEGATRN